MTQVITLIIKCPEDDGETTCGHLESDCRDADDLIGTIQTVELGDENGWPIKRTGVVTEILYVDIS